jgi:cobalt-zinc-cadmium efflux system membrane fusion protein
VTAPIVRRGAGAQRVGRRRGRRGTPLFEIADLSSLWVDLHIFGADASTSCPACR